jgi:hypothetical protein
MPVVQNNNFSLDTYGMRSERLIAIQSNFASIQPELSAPAEVATWSDDCYDVYANLLALSELEANESEGSTVVVAEKEDILDEVYQYVKNMGLTIYKDNPKLIQDYGFEFEYPIRRSEKLKFADRVIQCYNRNVTDLVTPLIPALMITRLQNARDDYKTALGIQDKERSDARHAVAVLSEQFVKDTQKLNELKLWTYAMLGKDEPRIGLIGMVNPGTSSNSNLAAPTNLTVDTATMIFSWDAVSAALNYKLFKSVVGIEWIEIYSGTDNFVHYVPEPEIIIHYKVVASNNIGDSPASVVMLYNYHVPPLPAPDYVSASIVDPITGEVALNWGEVSEATEYKLFKSTVAIGAEAGLYELVGQYAVATHTGIFALSQRHWFHVKATTIDKESLPSDAVFVEL